MNPAHLHIILNHIPVIGVPFGAVLLMYGYVRRSTEIKRASLLVFVFMALITIPTFLSGKAAEDMVEHLPGVTESTIESHEEAATIALIATAMLGVLALALFPLVAPRPWVRWRCAHRDGLARFARSRGLARPDRESRRQDSPH